MSKKAILLFAATFLLIFTVDSTQAVIRHGIGARSLGMGNAVTGFIDDITAFYFNPAGLGQVLTRQFFSQYDNLQMQQRFHSLAIAFPNVFKGTAAFSWQQYGVDGLRGYDSMGNFTDFFDSTESTWGFAYGNQITKWVALGLGLKYHYHKITKNFTADGFALDLGLMFTLSEKWSLGFAIKDVSTNLRWEGTPSEAVESVRNAVSAGVAYKPTKNIVFDFDVNKEEGRKARSRFGVEMIFRDTLSVRAGTDNGDVNVGVGVKLKKWQIEYAYSSNEIGDTNRISATVNLDDLVKDMKTGFARKREKAVLKRREKRGLSRNPELAQAKKIEKAMKLPKVVKVPDKQTAEKEIEKQKKFKGEVHRLVVKPVSADAAVVIADRSRKEIPKIQVKPKIVEVGKPVYQIRDATVSEIQNEAEYYISAGKDYLRKKEFNKALSAFKKAQALNPFAGQIYRYIALTYERLGDKSKALKYLKEALLLLPDNPELYISLGNLYAAMGEKLKAVKIYRKVIEIAKGTRYSRAAILMIKHLRDED